MPLSHITYHISHTLQKEASVVEEPLAEANARRMSGQPKEFEEVGVFACTWPNRSTV